MRKTLLGLVIPALVIGALAVTTDVAAANPADDYRETMGPFAHELDRWAGELHTEAQAAVAKPELACSEKMMELSRIGHAMVDDLKGTDAPNALEDAHDELTTATLNMAHAAAVACGDASLLAETITREHDDYFAPALTKIENFVDSPFSSGRAPVVPTGPGAATQ